MMHWSQEKPYIKESRDRYYGDRDYRDNSIYDCKENDYQLYGVYSAEADQRLGTLIYVGLNGKEMKIAEAFTGKELKYDRLENIYHFKDAVVVGPIKTFLRMSPERERFIERFGPARVSWYALVGGAKYN